MEHVWGHFPALWKEPEPLPHSSDTEHTAARGVGAVGAPAWGRAGGHGMSSAPAGAEAPGGRAGERRSEGTQGPARCVTVTHR